MAAVAPESTGVPHVDACSRLIIKTSEIELNGQQALLYAPLKACSDIVHSQMEIWYRRKIGPTSRRLRRANALLSGLLICILDIPPLTLSSPSPQLSNIMPASQKLSLRIIQYVRLRDLADFVNCISCDRGTKSTKSRWVISQRRLMQNNLISFINNMYEYIDIVLKDWASAKLLLPIAEQLEDIDVEAEPVDCE